MRNQSALKPKNLKQKSLWNNLINAPVGDERKAFAGYCMGQFALMKQKTITSLEAAYAIAGAYKLDRYDDSDQMEEIMHLALHLEVPANMNEKDWKRLHALVKVLDNESNFT